MLEQIKTLNADGWFLTDMWQTAIDNWHCVIRLERRYSVIAVGDAADPAAALRIAMVNRRDAPKRFRYDEKKHRAIRERRGKE